MAGCTGSGLWCFRRWGFASWRTVHAQRWPVEGLPPFFAGLEDYERRVETLLNSGVIFDRAMLYWHAPLSDRYPTVEIRVADVDPRRSHRRSLCDLGASARVAGPIPRIARAPRPPTRAGCRARRVLASRSPWRGR